METLKNLNKFWRSSALLPSATSTFSDAAGQAFENEAAEEEEEESFFELELVMLNCCRNEEAASGDRENESLRLSSKEKEGKGRRVVPIEPDLKPHSPISILKSAPKFKVSLFRKPKTEHNRVACTQADPDLKPKVDEEEEEEAATISTLIRENSSSSGLKVQRQNSSNSEDSSLPIDSSKRFSKDVMHKYLKLKLIKPFHIRVAKRCGSVTKSKLFDLRDSPASSPAPAREKLKQSSPAGGLRVVCKQLGKSRSASAMGSAGVRRRDESLLEQDDGIQSAILHCKRSFNSSRDSSMHSGDSTQQEGMT